MYAASVPELALSGWQRPVVGAWSTSFTHGQMLSSIVSTVFIAGWRHALRSEWPFIIIIIIIVSTIQ